ncbi:SurE domain-containing protein [Rhizoctonia solani AG-1 IA]|uniref:SurE domain-containing protein n=1 Tax=Thanatephorus cucumeris (strain AG1-IA) TaxID=983506 RepID=L8WS65_THACA|nr:SurE domain-containing protein [Rhizoctonia solani AG-1 IA]
MAREHPYPSFNTVDPKSADFLNVNNRALYAEYWQNPTSFSMNPHPQLTPVCRQGADSAILSADIWQNLDVIRIFRNFGVHRAIDTGTPEVDVLGNDWCRIDQVTSSTRMWEVDVITRQSLNSLSGLPYANNVNQPCKLQSKSNTQGTSILQVAMLSRHRWTEGTLLQLHYEAYGTSTEQSEQLEYAYTTTCMQPPQQESFVLRSRSCDTLRCLRYYSPPIAKSACSLRSLSGSDENSRRACTRLIHAHVPRKFILTFPLFPASIAPCLLALGLNSLSTCAPSSGTRNQRTARTGPRFITRQEQPEQYTMQLSLIATLLGSVAVQSALGAPAITERAQIKVLVGNDDGWAEANVRAFYQTLAAAGYNTVVSAPVENQSGTGSSDSAAKVLTKAGQYNSVPVGAPAQGFNSTDRESRLNYVNSYPVTAIKYGIAFFGGSPDIVVTGPNVGNDLGYLLQTPYREAVQHVRHPSKVFRLSPLAETIARQGMYCVSPPGPGLRILPTN